ncbi:MAG: DUF2778 domain-containing protein [Xanthobacteraceae bacterium]|jgi:hypothetical protein
MTRGMRHYFGTDQSEPFAVRHCAWRVAAATSTACLFAWLLGTILAEPHLDRHAPARVLLSTNPKPYNLFLDSRFDVYFSREIYSKALSQLSDFQQAIATVSLVTSPFQPAPAVNPSSAVKDVENPSVERQLVFTAHPTLQHMPQSVISQTGTHNSEPTESPLGDSKNVIERFFTKLLGKLSPSLVRLASAATDDSQLDATEVASRYDQWTAVYDISAHTVYMPDGTKLEAHSGFGESLDDPDRVDGVNIGPTPPNIYNLQLRERPFHGVRALRLIPVDDQKTLGRTGLLAHSFMLGPNGQSNGCVSFRDYDTFLSAYTTHRVKRLIVVARLD